MRTLCVAVVVLSLTSVCRPAPLAAEKPEDRVSDLTGTWYGIAMAADSCLYKAYTAALILPSTIYEIFSTDTPNIYTSTINMTGYGMCFNFTETFFYGNNTGFSDDFKNTETGVSELPVLTLSGCPDCAVFKKEGPTTFLMLFSRRQNISADQLEKFWTQAATFGLTMVHTMSSNYDYENCTAVDAGLAFDPTALGIPLSSVEKLESTFRECVIEKLPHTVENFDFKTHWAASTAGLY